MQLKRVPLQYVKGLQHLREQLKVLIVQRCLNDMEVLLCICGCASSNRARLTLPLLSFRSPQPECMTTREQSILPALKNALSLLVCCTVSWVGLLFRLFSTAHEDCVNVCPSCLMFACCVCSHCRTSLCLVLETRALPRSGQP